MSQKDSPIGQLINMGSNDDIVDDNSSMLSGGTSTSTRSVRVFPVRTGLREAAFERQRNREYPSAALTKVIIESLQRLLIENVNESPGFQQIPTFVELMQALEDPAPMFEGENGTFGFAPPKQVIVRVLSTLLPEMFIVAPDKLEVGLEWNHDTDKTEKCLLFHRNLKNIGKANEAVAVRSGNTEQNRYNTPASIVLDKMMWWLYHADKHADVISGDLVVSHLCRNEDCLAIDHLFLEEYDINKDRRDEVKHRAAEPMKAALHKRAPIEIVCIHNPPCRNQLALEGPQPREIFKKPSNGAKQKPSAKASKQKGVISVQQFENGIASVNEVKAQVFRTAKNIKESEAKIAMNAATVATTAAKVKKDKSVVKSLVQRAESLNRHISQGRQQLLPFHDDTMSENVVQNTSIQPTNIPGVGIINNVLLTAENSSKYAKVNEEDSVVDAEIEFPPPSRPPAEPVNSAKDIYEAAENLSFSVEDAAKVVKVLPSPIPPGVDESTSKSGTSKQQNMEIVDLTASPWSPSLNSEHNNAAHQNASASSSKGRTRQIRKRLISSSSDKLSNKIMTFDSSDLEKLIEKKVELKLQRIVEAIDAIASASKVSEDVILTPKKEETIEID